MTPQDKARIARENGAKSHGPKTEEGKARSSINNLKHGGYSSRLLINGESPEIFEELATAYFTLFRPEGQLENDLVYDIVSSRWRIRRFEAIEAALFVYSANILENDPHYASLPPDQRNAACLSKLLHEDPAFEAAAAFIQKNQRQYHKSLRTLERLRERAGRPIPACGPKDLEAAIPSNTLRPEAPSTPTPEPPKSKARTVGTLAVLLAWLLAAAQAPQGAVAHREAALAHPQHQNRGFEPSPTSESPQPPAAPQGGAR